MGVTDQSERQWDSTPKRKWVDGVMTNWKEG